MHRILRFIFICLSLIFIDKHCQGQDFMFSQFYNAPFYVNPAFVGATPYHRITMNNRIQWPQLPQAVQTHAVSWDYNVRKLNSGFGVMASSDRIGTANLSTNQMAFMYSYMLRIQNKLIVRPGLSFVAGNRSLDMDKLLFSDNNGVQPIPPNIKNELGMHNIFDFNTGLLVYTRNYWFSAAVYHLATPTLTFQEDGTGTIPIKYTFAVGGNFKVKQNVFNAKLRSLAFSPSLMYERQGDFETLSAGVKYYHYPVTIGLWYRGVPIPIYPEAVTNNQAFVFTMGLTYDIFEFGYSYDFGLGGTGSKSFGGAHELSIKILIKRHPLKRSKDHYKSLPCPAFYKEELFY
ncbi:PorP/SprF family type IX secretion system membrane protein [Persicobacter diffluens]